MYVIHRHWTEGRRNILWKLFFFFHGRNGGNGLLLRWCFFCYYLLLFVHLPMQTALVLLVIFLNSPAIFFAAVNILRIWEDFKCLCPSGLFLQKQLRTVFWQQEAYKNLERKKKKKKQHTKKIKHLKLNSYKRNAPLLPYRKFTKRSWMTWRKDHPSTETHPSAHAEWTLLDHSPACRRGTVGTLWWEVMVLSFLDIATCGQCTLVNP